MNCSKESLEAANEYRGHIDEPAAPCACVACKNLAYAFEQFAGERERRALEKAAKHVEDQASHWTGPTSVYHSTREYLIQMANAIRALAKTTPENAASALREMAGESDEETKL